MPAVAGLEALQVERVKGMLKKIVIILICCILFASCDKQPPDLEPLYEGNYRFTFFVNIEDHLISDDFVDDEMAADIKKVLKDHNVKDGPIDKETAVDIAIVVVKHHCDKDFFKEQTTYRISPRLDKNVYLIAISPKLDPNILIQLTTQNIAISQKDGSVVAYWVS